VVESKESHDRTKPNLKIVLRTMRFGSRGDALDALLNEARQEIANSFTPDSFTPEHEGDDQSRRRCSG